MGSIEPRRRRDVRKRLGWPVIRWGDVFDAAVREVVPVGGGLHEAFRVTLADGDRCFVKTGDSSDVFEAERDGLEAMRSIAESCDDVVVPTVRGSGTAEGRAWLAMDWIDGRGVGDDEDVGGALARWHRASAGTGHGWHRDNYLGTAIQPNTACEDWPTFIRERRIGFQCEWGSRTGRLTHRTVDAVRERIGQLDLGEPYRTCLIHGDLWSGNWKVDDRGRLVLFDPAVYRGTPAAEFGMLDLFGGIGPRFRRGYQRVTPMGPSDRREADVFRLYHLLNHVNLFGGGYEPQATRLIATL